MHTSPEIRADLRDAHSAALERIASPGTWWTGAERVAIARETRAAPACSLCHRRANALAPTFVSGSHDRASELPEAVVDAIHRITVDAGRIARSDYDSWAESFSDSHYVELLGVVVQIIAVDTLALALGYALPDLLEPRLGDPTRHRPPAARSRDMWAPTLPNRGRDEDSHDLYRGHTVPNVALALSLVPAEVRAMSALTAAHYLSARDLANVQSAGGRALSRPQIELIAARVSALNECFY